MPQLRFVVKICLIILLNHVLQYHNNYIHIVYHCSVKLISMDFGILVGQNIWNCPLDHKQITNYDTHYAVHLFMAFQIAFW